VRPPEAREAKPPAARAWLAPALLFAILVLLYGSTLSPTVGPGDSGELTAVLGSWGVAHAPGFPLLALIGNLVSLLPLPGEPALALNLMNALFAALACAVLAHAIGVATGDRWAGFAGGFLLGISATFWDYARVLEVFSLNALLAAVLIDLLAIFLRGRARGENIGWTLPAAAAVTAGVVTHHATLVLIAAPVAIVFAATRVTPAGRGARRADARLPYAAAILAFLAALTPILYLPIAAAFEPAFSWGDVRSPGALLDQLLRRDFGTGTLMAPAIVANEVLMNGESASPLGMRHFLRMGAELRHVLGWPAVALALAGLAWCLRRSRGLLLLVLLATLAIVLFYSRVNAPVTPLYTGITRPFALLPHLLIAFLAGLGVAWRFHAAGPYAVRGSSTYALVALLALCAVPAIGRWSEFRSRPHGFTRDFGLNFAAGMPAGSLVFSNGDYFRNSLLYARLGLGERTDLAPIEQPLLSRRWYVDQLRRRGTLELPPGFLALGADSSSNLRALIDLNIGERPITTVGLQDGSHFPDYEELPMGLWARVLRREERPAPGAWAREYARVVAIWRTESLGDEFPTSSWEHSQGRFYPYALGSLRALLDAAAAFGDPVDVAVPALEAAERWTGVRRGEYLADQADLWRRFLTDWRSATTIPHDSLVATRAVELARASLAVDSTQIQALQTLVAVMDAGERIPAAARHRDPFEEVDLRRRIVALRPGDPNEVRAYFTLARSLGKEPDPRVPEILRRAELDRRGHLNLLRLAQRVYPTPLIERRMREWDTPIASVPS